MRMTSDWNVKGVDDGSIVTLTVGDQRKSMVIHAYPSTIWYGLRKWESGAFVQDAFPGLTAEEREFLMTGMTPEEWAEIFGEEE